MTLGPVRFVIGRAVRSCGRRGLMEVSRAIGARDDLAKQYRLLFGRAVDLRLMREFETGASVALPANRALDRSVFAEMQTDEGGGIRANRPGDHRAAAGDIDELDLQRRATAAYERLLTDEPVTIAFAAVAPCRILRPRRGSLGVLRDSVNSRSDVHQRSHVAPAAQSYARTGYGIVHFFPASEAGGRWQAASPKGSSSALRAVPLPIASRWGG